ncbi:MAG TPA: hypothetical protein VIX62_01325, partial [Actinomycetota bacterium]
LEVRCKWPNDLLVDGRKVGGILAESAGGAGLDQFEPDQTAGAVAHVVIGSGINLVAPPEIEEAVGLGAGTDPTELLGGFLRRFREGYGSHGEHAASRSLDRWRAVADTLGRRVRAHRLDGEPIEGVARDVDEHGGLVVETLAGTMTVRFGEVEYLG